jgi:hypothetical protein
MYSYVLVREMPSETLLYQESWLGEVERYAQVDGTVVPTPICARVVDPAPAEPVWKPAVPPYRPEAPILAPEGVSRFQFKKALSDVSQLTAVNILISDAGTPPIVKLAWAELAEFKMQSDFIRFLAQRLNWTLRDVRLLFKAASEVKD